jgi:hypothetical protein
MTGSHARVACGEDAFARVYAHSGMVGYQGAKMSKSLGNLVFVSRLRADGADPMAIRLALLAHHYKSDWEWTDEELARAQARLGRWRAAVAPNGVPATWMRRGRWPPSTRGRTRRWPAGATRRATRRTGRSSATPPTRCSVWLSKPPRPLPAISHLVKQHFPVPVDFSPLIHSSIPRIHFRIHPAASCSHDTQPLRNRAAEALHPARPAALG